jgi:hypothetical protein
MGNVVISQGRQRCLPSFLHACIETHNLMPCLAEIPISSDGLPVLYFVLVETILFRFHTYPMATRKCTSESDFIMGSQSQTEQVSEAPDFSVELRQPNENIHRRTSPTILCDRTFLYDDLWWIKKTLLEMDAPEGPRRFSAVSPLLATQDGENIGKRRTSAGYGTLADPDELEALLGQDEEEIETSAGKEAWLLCKYSVPLMVTYLLQYGFSLVTIFVVGHIGTDELGAVSLATMTANITGFAVYEGLATSLDTLCAQAYGSGKKEQVGLHLQRMAIFMLLITIPIGAVWVCSGWILAALVPEKELAMLAGKYLRILLIGNLTLGYSKAIHQSAPWHGVLTLRCSIQVSLSESR